MENQVLKATDNGQPFRVSNIFLSVVKIFLSVQNSIDHCQPLYTCWPGTGLTLLPTNQTSPIIIPHQKLLQPDWLLTHEHFRCLVLSPFESCHMINIMLPCKPNIRHVRDIILLCKPNIYHMSFRIKSNSEKSRPFGYL